jgi:hypothetical protein
MSRASKARKLRERLRPKHIDVRQRDHDRVIKTEWEMITPDRAVELLERNTINRPLRQHYIEGLADMMRRGEWGKTHEGIAVDEAGNILDGQHRLWAIVESGVTLAMLVSYGQSRGTRLFIDSGLRRTLHDAITLVGSTHVAAGHVATATAMRLGLNLNTNVGRMSRDQMLAYVQRHWEALDFSFSQLQRRRTRGVSTATLCAVVSRAWYRGVDERTRLQAFCETMLSGVMSEPADEPAIVLRNLLTQTGMLVGRQLAYAKAERACLAFLLREPLAKLYETQVELFPLPEEAPSQPTRQVRRHGRSTTTNKRKDSTNAS